MDVTIRYATQEDLDLLSELGAKTFFDTYGETNTEENMRSYMRATFDKAVIMKELNNRTVSFLIAMTSDTAIGYAKLGRNNIPGNIALNQAIELERLYIVKEAKGRGVGSALMNACMALARSESFKVLWLGVWEHNHRAMDFYKKCGFEVFAEHTFMLGEDPQHDFLMKTEL